MATVTLVGSTGQVGSQILSTLLAHPSVAAVYAYTRRPLPNPTASTKITTIESKDASTWPAQFPREAHPQIFLSGLATTRSVAGGFDNQKKVDYDMNLAMAQAAKDAGVGTYVLISGAGASSKSNFAYVRMKGELEDGVTALGFKNTVLLRPGFIVGDRTHGERGIAESALHGVANLFKKASNVLVDSWAQDAETIGRAAVEAGLMCERGQGRGQEKDGKRVWVLGQSEIVELGRKKETK